MNSEEVTNAPLMIEGSGAGEPGSSIAAADPITYGAPYEQRVHTKVTPRKGDRFPPVKPHDMGLIVTPTSSGTNAGVAGWGAVIHALRWALERSPKMRADVRQMLDEIEASRG